MAATTTVALSTALRDFESSLSVQQKNDLHAVNATPDTNAVVAFTAQIDRENASRRVRGVAGRLHKSLESIQQFTTIVDTFVSANPQIAALVWGSFKVVILTAQKFASIDKVSEWFMQWGSYCPIFAAYRDLYPGSLGLQKALCLFYATLVQLCTKAVEVLQRASTTHFLKALNPFENGFDPLNLELQRHSVNVQEEIKLASAQAADHERQLQLLERNENQRYRRKAKEDQEIRELRRVEQDRRIRKRSLLDQLSKLDYVRPLRRERSKRCWKTGVWLSKSKEYCDWLAESSSSLFWLSGIPGAGKTVITAGIIDDLLLRNPSSQSPVRFFFCEHDHQTTLHTRTVLGCLARQCLTEESLSDRLEARIQTLVGGTVTDADALKDIIQEILEASKTLFIVIDGFDECSLEDRKIILQVLKRLSSSSSWVLKIFLSSRQDVGIELARVFGRHYHRAMECAENYANIGTYIKTALEEKVSTGELTVGDPNLLAIIRDALTEGAHGMFLWVSFQIADICDQICDEDIRNVIKELPRNLPETYERALHRIKRNNKIAIAQKVFRWVLAAKRPLSIEELGEAVVIEPCQHLLRPGQRINNVDLLLPWCGNLLIQDEEGDFVYFAHHTVKEFLLTQRTTMDLQCFSFELMSVDHEAGETCCTYLNLENFKKQISKTSNGQVNVNGAAIIGATLPAGQISNFLKTWVKRRRHRDIDLGCLPFPTPNDNAETQEQAQYSFLAYANEHWLSHTTTFSESTSKTWNLFDHLLKTEEDLGIRKWSSSKVLRYVVNHSHWALLAWKWNRYESGIEVPLSYCREYGTAVYCFKPTGKPSEAYTVLHERLLLLAADSPFDHARVIVSRAGLWDNVGRAIKTAARNGNLRQVEMLLSVRAPDRFELSKPPINDALQLAASRGHIGVVKRLLAVKNIDRSPEPIDTDAAIISAEGAGHKTISVMLSTAKKQIELRRFVLVVAAAAGNVSKVEALLESGVDVNVEMDGHTVLQLAAANDQFDLVNLLLHWRADFSAGAGSQNGTVLQEALREKRYDMVRHLCSASKQVRPRGDGHFGIAQPDIPLPCWRSKMDAGISGRLSPLFVLRELESFGSYDSQNVTPFEMWKSLIESGFARLDHADPEPIAKLQLALGLDPNVTTALL